MHCKTQNVLKKGKIQSLDWNVAQNLWFLLVQVTSALFQSSDCELNTRLDICASIWLHLAIKILGFQKMTVVWGKCLNTIIKIAFAFNYWLFDSEPDSDIWKYHGL